MSMTVVRIAVPGQRAYAPAEFVLDIISSR